MWQVLVCCFKADKKKLKLLYRWLPIYISLKYILDTRIYNINYCTEMYYPVIIATHLPSAVCNIYFIVNHLSQIYVNSYLPEM